MDLNSIDNNSKQNLRIEAILKNWGFVNIEGKSFKQMDGVSPGFTIGSNLFNMQIGTIYFSDELLSILNNNQLEFCVLHEVAHIIHNDHISTVLTDLTSLGGILLVSEGFKVNPQIPAIFIKFLRTFMEKSPNGMTKAQELRADNWAARSQQTNEYGIQSLNKISNGNMNQVSHTSKGFTFEVPVLRIGERIDALYIESRFNLLPGYEMRINLSSPRS